MRYTSTGSLSRTVESSGGAHIASCSLECVDSQTHPADSIKQGYFFGKHASPHHHPWANIAIVRAVAPANFIYPSKRIVNSPCELCNSCWVPHAYRTIRPRDAALAETHWPLNAPP